MKLHSNNEILNLINETDINLADGSTLSAKLSETLELINELKNNVKWLYKYGGVGGSGSGGGGSSKLKTNFTITYIDLGGNKKTEPISSNSQFNIQKGTSVNISCKLSGTPTFPKYGLELQYSENASLKTEINITDSDTGTITYIPIENSLCYITLRGDAIITKNFYIYTDIMRHESLVLCGDIYKATNAEINPIPSTANKDDYFYYFLLINYRPTEFNFSLSKISINGQEVIPQELEPINGDFGEITYKYKIPFEDIFINYGIYKINVEYIFGNSIIYIENNYIYKDGNPFIFCFSDSIPIYFRETSDPSTYNAFLSTLQYRIYKGKTDKIDESYSIDIVISKYNNGKYTDEDPITKITLVDKIQNVTIQNSDTNWEKPVKISFSLVSKLSSERLTYVYYLYLTKPKDLDYFFKTDNNTNFYNVVYCDNKDLVDIHNLLNKALPKGSANDNGWVTILDELSFELQINLDLIQPNKIDNNNLLLSIPQFVENSTKDSNAPATPDMIYTFGIKYLGNNYDLPIFTILDTDSNKIIVYKNKIINEDGTVLNSRLCIPKDDQFHLVLLYIKSHYVIGTNEDTYASNDISAYATIFIDGVIECVPFKLDRSPNEALAQLILHAGTWKFNYIGVSCFNMTPSEDLVTKYKDVHHPLMKYLHDFDSIIPANYYLTYTLKILGISNVEKNISKDIYGVFSKGDGNRPLWINYFNIDSRDEKSTKTVNKFITVSSAQLIISLCSGIDSYLITPLDIVTGNDFKLNSFISDTYNSYSETAELQSVKGNFLKWNGTDFTDLLDESVEFDIKFLGSSTLLYSAKNFEINTVPKITGEGNQQIKHNIYFTPDVDTFPKAELGFYLKADLVDSSHSNNVIIGNFFHEYTKDRSPFGKDSNGIPYRACLTGKPVLLFISNNINTSKGTSRDSNELIFLGIYSLNLGRSSVNNLGYTKIINNDGNEVELLDSSNHSKVKYYITLQNDIVYSEKAFRVAEVLGNSTLFDFSQYSDPILLSSEMFGDYYNYISNNIEKTYNNSFAKIIKTLSKHIKDNITSKNVFYKYNYLDYIQDKKYKNEISLKFKEYNYNFEVSDNTITIQADGTVKINGILDESACVISSETFNSLTTLPYKLTQLHESGKKIVFVPDPEIQAFVLLNDNGTEFKDASENKYYLFKKTELGEYDEENDPDILNLRSLCDYYVVCMAFAMVDSVLKNLTLKCKNANASNPEWFLSFYDMDTAFGVSNSGGDVTFLAFSDYVDESGSIILDFAPHGSVANYDIPSTYLFLYAKYIGILNKSLTTGFTEDLDKGVISPYKVWSALRKTGGLLENVNKFYERFVDSFYGNIHPLVWSLNYLYKYFSSTLNTSKTDTESNRFHGTRRASRKEWLDKRLKYLDAMFGFKANRTIGLTTSTIGVDKEMPNQDNSDITIYRSMFPIWGKGTEATAINADVVDEPKTPIILQSADNVYTIKLTNNEGKANFTTNIETGTLVGFYGTTTLKSINECGLFLVMPGDALNSIKNNVIKDIKITKKTCKILIDLKDLLSIETIQIVPTSKIKITNLEIQNAENSPVTTLKKLIIKNIVTDNISITSKENLIIQELVVLNCEASMLNLNNINVISFTQSSNYIKKYIFTAFTYSKNITITDSKTQELSLENSTLSDFECSFNNLNTLSLSNVNANICTIKGNGSLFSNPSNSSITFSNLNVNKLEILNRTDTTADDFSKRTNLIDLTLLFSKDVKLALRNLPIKKLTLLGNKEITFINYGLLGCSELLEINPNSCNLKTGTARTFLNCKKLNHESKILVIPTKADYYERMFSYTNLVYYENEIIKFFPTYFFTKMKEKGAPKPTNLKGIFAYCEGEMYATSDTLSETTLVVNTFVESLLNILDGEKIKSNNAEFMFTGSKFNVFTKEFSNLLENNSIYKVVLGGELLYFETGSLDKFSQIYFSGGRFDQLWTYSNICSFYIKEELVILETQDNKLSNYFSNNCKTSIIEQFNPYCTTTYKFKFDISFPSTLKLISLFYTNNSYIENLETGFANVEDCLMYKSFVKSVDENQSNKVDLFNLLFKKQDEDNYKYRVVMNNSFEYGSNGIITGLNCDFNFQKTITSENLKKVISLIILEEKTKTNTLSSYKSIYRMTPTLENLTALFRSSFKKYCINSLFSHCVITDIAEDENWKIIVDDKEESLFDHFVMLNNIFNSAEFYNNSGDKIAIDPTLFFGTTQIINQGTTQTTNQINSQIFGLAGAFANTYLKKFVKKLNIQGVSPENLINKNVAEKIDMSRCFENCLFDYTGVDKEDNNYPFASPNLFLPIDNYKCAILPIDFFNFKNTTVIATGCFLRFEFNSKALTGYFPESKFTGNVENWKNVFTKCNILYSYKEEENKYFIFPQWYCELTDKTLNVCIPLVKLTVDNSVYTPLITNVYLFERELNTYSYMLSGVQQNSFPILANTSTDSTKYAYERLVNYLGNIQLDPGLNKLIKGDVEYKKLINYLLAIVLKCNVISESEMLDAIHKPLLYDEIYKALKDNIEYFENITSNRLR